MMLVTESSMVTFPMLCSIKEVLLELVRNFETKQSGIIELCELGHLLTEAWIDHCTEQLTHACDWMKKQKKQTQKVSFWRTCTIDKNAKYGAFRHPGNKKNGKEMNLSRKNIISKLSALDQRVVMGLYAFEPEETGPIKRGEDLFSSFLRMALGTYAQTVEINDSNMISIVPSGASLFEIVEAARKRLLSVPPDSVETLVACAQSCILQNFYMLRCLLSTGIKVQPWRKLVQLYSIMRKAEEQHKSAVQNANESFQKRLCELTQLNENKIQQLEEDKSKMNEKGDELEKRLQETKKNQEQTQQEISILEQKLKTAQSKSDCMRAAMEEQLKAHEKESREVHTRLSIAENQNREVHMKLRNAVESSKKQKEKIGKLTKKNHFLLNAKNELKKEVTLPYIEETAKTWYTDQGVTLNNLLGTGSKKKSLIGNPSGDVNEETYPFVSDLFKYCKEQYHLYLKKVADISDNFEEDSRELQKQMFNFALLANISNSEKQSTNTYFLQSKKWVQDRLKKSGLPPSDVDDQRRQVLCLVHELTVRCWSMIIHGFDIIEPNRTHSGARVLDAGCKSANRTCKPIWPSVLLPSGTAVGGVQREMDMRRMDYISVGYISSFLKR